MEQLWIAFREPWMHCPITQVKRVLLKQLGETGLAGYRVELENRRLGEGPVEVEIVGEALREFSRLRVRCVVEDENVAEPWPDQEIDDEGVFKAYLRGSNRCQFVVLFKLVVL
jgi:hypothetical protein